MISLYNREPRPETVPAWVLPPLSCKFLEDVAALLPPGTGAFEFGSGRSTHSLRRASSGTTTIENSEEWLSRTEHSDRPITKRPEDYSKVVPLRRCWNRLRLIESFDIESQLEVVRRLEQARLILVDSPPNPTKREHALFLALAHAPVGAVIVLDDLEIRATNRFAQRLARQNAKRFRFWTLDIDHTIGIFLKLRPGRIRSKPTLVEFVGTWLRA